MTNQLPLCKHVDPGLGRDRFCLKCFDTLSSNAITLNGITSRTGVQLVGSVDFKTYRLQSHHTSVCSKLMLCPFHLPISDVKTVYLQFFRVQMKIAMKSHKNKLCSINQELLFRYQTISNNTIVM